MYLDYYLSYLFFVLGSLKQKRPNEIDLPVKAQRTETSKLWVLSLSLPPLMYANTHARVCKYDMWMQVIIHK